MPVVKPITSKAIFEAVTGMNKSLEKLENKRQQKLMEEEAKARIETASLYEAANRREMTTNKFARFSEDVKTKLLASLVNEVTFAAMDKVNEKLGKDFFVYENKNTISAMTYSFIHENGEASGILYNITKGPTTLFLDEVTNQIKKTHKTILEGVDREDPNSFHADPNILHDFKQHAGETFGHDELVDTIADRVSETIKDFMIQNAEDKQRIIDALSVTKEKIDSLPSGTPDEVKESYINLGRKYVTNVREKKHGLFNEMVLTMSKSVITTKNEALKNTFMNEGHLDVEKIVNSMATMYTFVEAVNSMKLIKVDEAFVMDMLDSIKSE